MTALYTSLYASLLTLWFMYLTAKVVMMRRKLRIGTGDGGHKELNCAIRAHGNFFEYVPLALLLMLIYELNHGAIWLLNVCGILLLIGRILHGLGLSRGTGLSFGRFYGSLLTWTVMVVLAVLNILRFVLMQTTRF